jgi:hypothetical protein
MRLIEADVTRLGATGVGSGFPFLLEFGLFQDEMTDAQREAMGREVRGRGARHDADDRLGARTPRAAAARRAAATSKAAFPGWKVVDEEAF